MSPGWQRLRVLKRLIHLAHVVPRIAGFGAPAAITEMGDLSEGKVLGQVSSTDQTDFSHSSC